jgi:glycosyltransferase involved in cell wall biosynthesis
MNGPLLFSIIIANYNKGDNIRPLMESIFADGPPDDFEVLFMDDASTDQSAEVAEQYPVTVRRGSSGVGPARLRNLAARDARGEYLLFMDSDVILPAGTLCRFRELCLTGGFGSVSGLEVLPPVIDNWIGWFRTLQVQDYFGSYREFEGPIDAWGATLGGVRRELFARVGGFDEAYRGADVEDHALALKLKELEPMIFSSRMTYRHSYPDTIGLVVKQFRRASQMVCLGEGSVVRSSLLFRWRFKVGHLLSVAAVAAGGASVAWPEFLWPAAGILALKVCFNRYLFSRALALKGPLFALYALAVSLVMGVSIVAGALYGLMRQEQP